MKKITKRLLATLLTLALVLGCLGGLPGMLTVRAADPPPEGYEVSPGWDGITSYDHPRVWFNATELASLKESVTDDEIGAFGYSFKESYADLIEESDRLVEETIWSYDYPTYGFTQTYDLEAMPDPNTLGEDWSGDLAGFTGVYPYPYVFSQQLQLKMQSLALAYALSGEAKYAEKAIHYLTGMAEWDDWKQNELAEYENRNCNMMTAHYVTGAAAVYDMCYDKMTVVQREAAKQAIAEKGLKPMYDDLALVSIHNKWLLRAGALLAGAVAIVDDSNRETMEDYLTRGYRFTEWYLDYMNANGEQEGWSYIHESLEYLLDGIDAISRFAGKTDILDHAYFTDVLVDWVLYFIVPGNGKMPPIGDSGDSHYFFKTMAILNKSRDNAKAGFFLQESKSGLEATAFARLLYTDPTPVVATEDEVYQSAVKAELYGYGALRSNWSDEGMLMTMIGNNSKWFHNHYDQNSFILGYKGTLYASDAGYALNVGNPEDPRTVYDFTTGHNTIFVDGVGQTVKGNGSLTTLNNSKLYGQILGSAAGAYGDVLDVANRHAILVNHKNTPYYVVIDDLAAGEDHVYGWNLFTKDWSAAFADGQELAVNGKINGNVIAVEKGSTTLFAQFVNKDPLEITAIKPVADEAPLIRVNSPAASKYQFMSILTLGNNGKLKTLFADLVPDDHLEKAATLENGVAWSSQSTNTGNICKPVSFVGTTVLMFRGGVEGDWLSVPFNVEKTGEYDVTITMGQNSGYKGNWEILVDGEPCEDLYCPTGPDGIPAINLGKRTLTAGEHTIKIVLESDAPANTNCLISIEGITLNDGTGTNESFAEVTETYDTEAVLGAQISYAEDLSDVILFNRGTGSITAGGVTTDAKQASILAISGSKISEGFAVAGATTLSYGDQNLLTAGKALNMVADYTGDVASFDIDSSEAQTIKLYTDRDVASVKVGDSAAEFTKEGNLIVVEIPAGESVVTLSTVADEPVTPPAGGETVTPPAGDVPPTGDDSYAALLAVVMMLAAAAFVTTKVKFGFGK